MKKKSFKLLAFPLVMAPLLVAQEPARTAAYRVKFFLTETGANQAAVTHDYSMLLSPASGNNEIEVGSRVPIRSGADKYDYQSVGLSLRCTLMEARRGEAAPANGPVRLMVDVDVSSAVAGTLPNLPVIHTAEARVDTAVPLAQRVTVAKFGDLSSGAIYQLDVIAEPAPDAHP